MIHLWHELSAGPRPPDIVYAVIEVPKGSRNKYEYAKRAGVIKLDRVLYSSLHYPGDYGFIPQTYFEDGDPLDILVMVNEPTFPGCVIEARPIAMFKMIDKGDPDYKILAVPATDPHFNDYVDLNNVPKHFPTEVMHFFMTYKQLEGAEVKNEGWTDASGARDTIRHALDLYHETFPTQGL
ncbi:MAG: inorganic pyrophosphatase [Anaerolineaceae bacterium]|nr:inorganic pyrophosphatase [Anaerolineaceae bacterium]